MASRRILISLLALALAAAACGGGGSEETTTTVIAGGPESIPFVLTVDDDEKTLSVLVGDEIVPRLTLDGVADPGWEIVQFPDPAVVRGGDDLQFFPSEEERNRDAYHEFNFLASGPGITTIVLRRIDGTLQVTFTVEVSEP